MTPILKSPQACRIHNACKQGGKSYLVYVTPGNNITNPVWAGPRYHKKRKHKRAPRAKYAILVTPK